MLFLSVTLFRRNNFLFIINTYREEKLDDFDQEGYIRLEYFSEDVAADKNRKEFDIKNHTLCYTNQRPDFLFIGDSITEYWELNAYFRNSGSIDYK